ncbi:ComEC/Rec2 family competence protein [Aneurinibacillus terranovensis]|uniref:ComEC/Rec2 family competence protein n=1 Tax=Aneurinibacillus terranovensis TaxID=278991 RepID=UPI000419A94A|nr:MBL fold metallo-hydrolase [Aneurinibacillus terranovensis]
MTRRKWPVFPLSILLLLFTGLGCSAAMNVGSSMFDRNTYKEKLYTPAALDAQFLGIPDGEATLLHFPSYNVLIDTGTNMSGRSVVELLRKQHILQVDLLVLTNNLEDYAGGAGEIIHELHVKKLIVPASLAPSILRRIGALDMPVRRVKKGDVLVLPEGAKIQVLLPTDPLLLSPEDNSLVLQLTYNKMKMLFTSGIHAEAERRLLGYNLRSQILKVSDEGCNAATDPFFLKKVDPQTSIIFTGSDGLSRKDVVRRLAEDWSDVYQVCSKGTVHVLTNGHDYQIYTERLTKGSM